MKQLFSYIKKKAIASKSFLIRLGYKIWGEDPFEPKPPKELPLNSLSPVGDADTDGVFGETLYWALKHRREKDIKNIAITGPYGSGKSSLLKTFQEKNRLDPDLKFLSISLATFKEEKDLQNKQPNNDIETDGQDDASKFKQTKQSKTEGEDLLRLIELSILQQLFYFEKDKKIPDSRFKKIKSFSKGNLWGSSLLIILFAVAIIFQINPCFIPRLLRIECSDPISPWIHFPAVSIVMLLGFVFVFKSIRSLRTITLKSLKLQDTAEFEISETINKSILNHHIDEILYFFEVTSYTVVIIEDLDRFEQTEIFTKLRELNLLINRSKKIKREIVFIYAVRDELFRGEKERTKFFDFILPVIPVINSSNSGEKLLNIMQQSQYPLSNDLIEDVSWFIDDMRLLYNITNEYYLYSKKLGTNLDQNKLFAMMVYKNLYPEDFAALGNGQGKLVQFFNEKEKLLKESVAKVDQQITTAKAEIKVLEGIHIKDIAELRKLYLIKYVTKLSNVLHFSVSGTNYTMNQLDEISNDADLFDGFVKNKVQYTYLNHGYQNQYRTVSDKLPVTFQDIENQVDSEFTYIERLAQIEDYQDNKSESLRQQIEELEKKKMIIRHEPLRSLFQQTPITVKIENRKQLQLVKILLRNGYIDEHYHDYISIFYEGSITKEDREFLLNLKAQLSTDYGHKLTKTDNLIGKIEASDFERPHILNYALVDYLFETDAHADKRKAVVKLLANESEESFSFINNFIDRTMYLGTFIRTLTGNWSNYWKFIRSQNTLTHERTRLFLQLMLEHSELNAIILMTKQSDLAVYLADRLDFFQLISDHEKLKTIVQKLKIKFRQLDFKSTEETNIHFLHEGSYYLLNETMIRGIVASIGEYDEDTFTRMNYYALQQSGCTTLLDYIDENINDYLSKVYLKLPENKEEDDESLVDLINHSEISPQNKTMLLQFTTTKVLRLSDVESLDDYTLLVATSKIEPTWENVIAYYYEFDEINADLIAFLNIEANTAELAKAKIDVSENTQPSLDVVKAFIPNLLKTNDLDNAIYRQLLQSVPWPYNRIAELNTIELKKIELLINARKLNLTDENYKVVREHFADLHIDLIKKHPSEFLKNVSTFEANENDIYQLLNALEFSTAQKGIIARAVDQTIIMGSNRLMKLCGELLLAAADFTILKESIQKIVLSKSLSTSQRIQLFNKQRDLFAKDGIKAFLESLPAPYSEMAILRRSPTLEYNTDNLAFAVYLKSAGMIVNYSETKKGIKISTFRK